MADIFQICQILIKIQKYNPKQTIVRIIAIIVQMGQQQSKWSEYQQRQPLRVATLNFSGRQLSPFQYFANDKIIEQKKINTIFLRNLNIARSQGAFSQPVMKDLSAIDKHLKIERYSPLYDKYCGVHQGKFVTFEGFEKLWRKKLDKCAPWQKIMPKKYIEVRKKEKAQFKNREQYINRNIFSNRNKSLMQSQRPKRQEQEYQKYKKKIEQLHKKQEQILQKYSKSQFQKQYEKDLESLMRFDYMAYIAILQYVYDNTNIDNIISDRSCTKYIGFMEDFFNKDYLNQKKKIDQVISFITRNNIDVLFMQEATDEFCQEFQRQIKDYRFIVGKKLKVDQTFSAIILKESSFPKAHVGRKGNLKFNVFYEDRKIIQEQKQRFLIWGKSAVMSIDNFILLSADTEQFTQSMQNDLLLIRQKFPSKYLIVGGRFRKSTRKFQQIKKKYLLAQNDQFEVFPPEEEDVSKERKTCYKKRTDLQFQQGKINQLINNRENIILYDIRLNPMLKNKYRNKERKRKDRERVQKEEKQIYNKYKDIIEHKDGYVDNGIYTVNQIYIQQQQYSKSPINILTNLKNKQKSTTLKKLGYIPKQEHPFDQLIVVKTFVVPRKRKKNKNTAEYKAMKKLEERLEFESSSSMEDDEGIDEI